jgi:hypothetical protein
MALRQVEATPPLITLEGYTGVKPLNHDIVGVLSAAGGPGLVVVELCAGIMGSTEALIRFGVKIAKLHACEIDPKARAVALARLEVLSRIWPDRLPTAAFENCFAFLPQNIKLINNSHVHGLGHVDLIICGFPCQGFSRASGQAQGHRDPRSAVFLDMIHLVQLIIRRHGNCGWMFENVDATDHPDLRVRQEYNEVVKGALGQGIAFDAIAVHSYAHRHRRFWTNPIPSSLLHEMVKKRFEKRSPVQTVQEVLGPRRLAQKAQHAGAPGPHSVNIVGQTLRAFATFVTFKDSHAYTAGAQSLVVTRSGLEAPTADERERAMGFSTGTTINPAFPPNESKRLRLLSGSMDMHQLDRGCNSLLEGASS